MAEDAGLGRQRSISARRHLTKAVADTALQETLKPAAKPLDVRIVQVNVLDESIQHISATVGGAPESIPRADCICDEVVGSGRGLTLDDLSDMDRIPPTAAHVRTYFGFPITGREGLVIGSLCTSSRECNPRSRRQARWPGGQTGHRSNPAHRAGRHAVRRR